MAATAGKNISIVKMCSIKTFNKLIKIMINKRLPKSPNIISLSDVDKFPD